MFEQQSDRVALMRTLFPELARSVDEAYAHFAVEDGADKLDEWIEREADRVLPGAASLVIDDDELAARFDGAFADARVAAGLLGVHLPEIESFVAAGVNLRQLAGAMAEDESLSPVFAPHGLGESRWVEAFSKIGTPSVLISEEASREFSLLDTVRHPAPPTVRMIDESHEGQRVPVVWTLRVIPAAAAPPLLGLSFANGPHVGLTEMLMLQLTRAINGAPLLDKSTFTWLAGGLAGGRLAARHVYDASEQTIRITCREVVSQGPHLGARPPRA